MTPLVTRMTPKLVRTLGNWWVRKLVTTVARTSSRERMEEWRKGVISWREMVMQRYPRKQERARQKRINHSEKIMEVIEEDKIWESPIINENPTARITTKIATQSRRTATGTG